MALEIQIKKETDFPRLPKGREMSHDARAVANQMIRKGIRDGNPFTPLQVIKLTYLCQAWMLGMFGRRMYHQEVEAWQYGPVIADVYHSVKKYGDRPVRKTIKAVPANFDGDEQHILDQVYKVYGGWTGIKLSRLTHAPGSPWYKTKQDNPLGRNVVIQEGLIRNYYAGKLERSKARNSSGGNPPA